MGIFKKIQIKKETGGYMTADEKRFIEESKPQVGDPDYSSGHSVDVDGNCNMGCC